MPPIAFLRSCVLRSVAPAVFLSLCLCAQSSRAQAQQPASPPKPAAASTPSVDYTRHEIQPSLDIDHDPVPSPDAADNEPATPGKALAKEGAANVYTLHENVDEVLLNCTVVDESGRLVSDLNRKDFHVWEDNVLQNVTSFQHRDVPVSLGILVDNSGSMRDKRTAVDEAALDLVRHSNPQDAAFIVNFSEKAYLDQGFTSNISDLEKGLSHYDARGTTAIYDAVAASADELSKHAKWPKQVLLIITDGADDASRLSLEQAVRRVEQLSGPVVYSIGLLYDSDNKQDMQRARDALQELSNETGGVAYFPKSLQEVDDIANEVARVIRNQYTLGYHSTKPASLGGYRTVRVEAVGPKHSKLIVRTRKGYYSREIKEMHEVQTAQQAK